MPAPATRTTKLKPRAVRSTAKSPAKRRRSRGPSFGEWVRKNAGIMKDGPPDLSMREGFGD